MDAGSIPVFAIRYRVPRRVKERQSPKRLCDREVALKSGMYSHLYLTATLPNGSRRAAVHAKLDCCVAQIVDTYRGVECY